MSDVTPVIAAIGGSLVGVAGVAATYLTGKGQRATAVIVARLQAQHQAELAREERHQRRLEAAYRDLMNAVDATVRELRFASAAILAGRDMDPKEKEAFAAIEAVLDDDRWELPLPVATDQHLWSDRISALEEEFRLAAEWISHGIDRYSNAVYYRMLRTEDDPLGKARLFDPATEREQLRAYLKDLNEAARVLRVQIRAELVNARAMALQD